MKLTKAKYNWLVAQYNYRKNKEQLIEISDEEYERLTNNLYPSQFPIIIGTWKGNMAQIENYRFGDNETSYIDSEITFLNNGKTYNGIWTTYYNDNQFISYFNWNVNNGIICINFDDGSNGEITRYDLRENRFRGVFCDVFCDNIEEVGSFDLYKFNNSYQCNFIFDTSLHPLPCLLTNILDNPGHFCKITIQIRNGIKHLHITSNYDCAFEDIPLTTEIENQHNYTLGINNCIIVGKSSYDNILVAYDGCCPNCNDKELQWTNNSSQLSCGDCKLSYDVNNGVIINGNGKQLLKYLCDYNGTILRVWN